MFLLASLRCLLLLCCCCVIAAGSASAYVLEDRESAIVATLEPGNYTAIIRGQNNTAGVALVEVYNLDFTSAASK